MNRRRFIHQLIISAGSLSAGMRPSRLSGESVLDMGMQAEQLLRGGRFRQAAEILQQALQLDPVSDWLRGMLGRAYAGLGETAAALVEFRRILQTDPENDLARIWVDLLTQQAPDRLLTSGTDSQQDRMATAEQEAFLRKQQSATAQQPYRISRIVIDAGHGGFDPGAVGPTGLRECDVNLAIARELERILTNRRTNLRLFQTRMDDYYVPLSERTVIANRHKADLFISVHCNSHNRSTARGSETYYCSEKASSVEAQRVAKVENAVLRHDPPPQVDRGHVDIEDILFRLARSRYWQESARLARNFQSALAQTPDVPDRGIHSADFFVLRKAQMPAVLLEVAFISNRNEERLLGSPHAVTAIADAVAASVTAL